MTASRNGKSSIRSDVMIGSVVIHQAYQEIHVFKNFAANRQVLLSKADISDFPDVELAFSPDSLLKMVSVKITFPFCPARLQLPKIV